jgi:hypothetical protein
MEALRPPRVRSVRALWRGVRAPFFALLLAVVLLQLQHTPFRVPNPAMVLLVFAVFATYTWRLRDGLATGLIAVAFAFAYYS